MNKKVADWTDLDLSHMFYAYRKAKADCFYESSVRSAERFVHFEKDLVENLKALLAEVHSGGASKILDAHLGHVRVFPKGLIVPKIPQEQHAFFSDAEREFQRLANTKPQASFRIIGEFDIEIHIISALWVNLIGHRFDAKLSSRALGNRLRRYKQSFISKNAHYHLDAIGSFEPYYEPYRRWRDDGIKKISHHLEIGESVVALTLDFSNFYHRIDPIFLRSEDFQRDIGVKLSEFEKDFTD